jgi:hypothetical protein
MRSSLLAGFCCLAFSLSACSSAPPPPPAQAAPAQKAPQGSGDPLAQRMKEYLDNGLDKLDQGAISEGIAQLVAVLAEHAAAAERSAQAEELRLRAETELAKVRAGLAMESGTEWLDANKNQVAASSVSVGGEKALNPSVILTLNYGGAGKALVTGAPVQFEFVKGGGLLTAFVNTNDYGQAGCNLARLDNPDSESVVRASLVYKIKGFTYAFEGLTKDFVYAPPSRKATILVMERAGGKAVEDPVILDAVFNKLKGVAFDFSQYDGRLLGEEFLRVFGGDPQAIRSLGLEKEVSYLVMVLNDGYNVSQIELQGKKYNIWKSQTTATTRLIRVADGKIRYSGTVQAVGGQGGTAEKAVLDGFRCAAAAMADKIAKDLGELQEVLAGK